MQITHTCSQNILTPLAPDLSFTFSLSPLSLTLSSRDGDLFSQWGEAQASQDNHMYSWMLLNWEGKKRSREGLKGLFIHVFYHWIILDPEVRIGFHIIFALPPFFHPPLFKSLLHSHPLLPYAGQPPPLHFLMPHSALCSPLPLPSPYLIFCPFKWGHPDWMKDMRFRRGQTLALL